MCLKIWPKPLRAYDGLKFLKNPKTILKINQMVSLKQGKYTNHTKKAVPSKKTKNQFLDKVYGSMCTKFQVCIFFRLTRRRDTNKYINTHIYK